MPILWYSKATKRQKEYQNIFNKSQQKNIETIKQLSSALGFACSTQNYHNMKSMVDAIKPVENKIMINTHWIYEKYESKMSKVKMCNCSYCVGGKNG